MQTSKTRILIIEDNAQDIESLTELLSTDLHFPITLEHCRTLAEGMERLALAAFKLILLNPQLPDAQGLACFQVLHQAFGTIPLIIYSDGLEEELALKLLQLGAQDCLIKKQCDQTNLCCAIRHSLERHGLALELSQATLALHQISSQLEQTNRKLQELAVIDSLTGVYNRRRFDTVLLSEWIRLMRENQSLSLIKCDIDYFKAYGNTYGHQAADQGLHQIAQTIRQSTRRPTDCVARYNRTEFVVTLPNTDISGATHVAKLIHRNIHQLALPHTTTPLGGYVTLSLGVASQVPRANIAPSTLVEAADQALSLAQQEGGDRIYPLCSDSPVADLLKAFR